MKEIIINSFDDYVEYMEKYKNKFLFRGQANINWDVTPSIFRNEEALRNEAESVREKLEDSNNDILVTLFELQHYGSPTRLLDLTISPLSALFFSIDSEAQNKNDGVVYVIDRSQQHSIDSDDLHRFAEYIIKSEEDIVEKDVVGLICQDYLIKYDYNISYTNKRSILQGGTALIFGFDIVDNKLIRKSLRSIDNIILEKIIIPSKSKNQMMKELGRIGYDRDILYGASDFETSEALKYEKVDFKLTQAIGFNKIIAKFRIDQLRFNRDQLLDIVKEVYEDLFIKYGYNARIYLYFLYDDNDVSIGNWPCRTQWDADLKYKIIWNKDYYSRRLSNMNEQISHEELITEFESKIYTARQIHKKVIDIVTISQYDINELISFFNDCKVEIKRAFIEVSDIGVGDIEIEKYAEAADNYICNVDLLVSEMSDYAKRGENEKFLRYWVETRLNYCNKAYAKYTSEVSKLDI